MYKFNSVSTLIWNIFPHESLPGSVNKRYNLFNSWAGYIHCKTKKIKTATPKKLAKINLTEK